MPDCLGILHKAEGLYIILNFIFCLQHIRRLSPGRGIKITTLIYLLPRIKKRPTPELPRNGDIKLSLHLHVMYINGESGIFQKCYHNAKSEFH
jgi:hypothetical protein